MKLKLCQALAPVNPRDKGITSEPIGIVPRAAQTAKANGVESYAWLRRVLRELPAAKTLEDVEALLPWNLRLPEISPTPLPLLPRVYGALMTI